MLAGMMIPLLFLIGCAGQLTDDELNSELDGLSDEELSALGQEPGALAGQAIQLKSSTAAAVKKVQKSVQSYSCSPSGDSVRVSLMKDGKEAYSRIISPLCKENIAAQPVCFGSWYRFEQTQCQFGCSAGSCIQPVIPEDQPVQDFEACDLNFESYPCYFVDRNNNFNGKLVVGQAAPATDNLAMTDIATGMRYQNQLVGFVNVTVLDSEVASVYSQNLVSVGHACNNRVTAQLLGIPQPQLVNGSCPNKALNDGEVLILLSRPGNSVALVVAGSDDEMTRLGAKILATSPQLLSGTLNVCSGTNITTVRCEER
ncbi:hypothetical protein COV20_01220 [Candidatus Woesearchaeota archaeon CG10_big_fil_rev_8_21_14_0_10_45_16]|nr:MAG: hypothetical protein COV20_01220 [Candidatus Woesearchaeota archaeon CG10_big_fil_rev_8_21_14_0_10_45_16]